MVITLLTAIVVLAVITLLALSRGWCGNHLDPWFHSSSVIQEQKLAAQCCGAVVKRRILVIAAHPSIVPAELTSIDADVVTFEDYSVGIAQAIALAPDYVVLKCNHDAIAIVREITDRLPQERYPSFLIVGPPRLDSTGTIPMTVETVQNADQIDCHGLKLDRRKIHASIDGRDLTLTLTEFQIIWELALRPGHVQTRDDLVTACRREKNVAGRRTIDQHIRSLRNKLESRGNLIETVRGLGYRFRDCSGQEFVNGCMTC